MYTPDWQSQCRCLKQLPSHIENALGIVHIYQSVVIGLAIPQHRHKTVMSLNIERDIIQTTVARDYGNALAFQFDFISVGNTSHIDRGFHPALCQFSRTYGSEKCVVQHIITMQDILSHTTKIDIKLF